MLGVHAAFWPLQEPTALQPDQLIMLAEAASKAAEHVALLRVLQQQQQQRQQSADGTKVAQDDTGVAAAIPKYQQLSEARGATGAGGDPIPQCAAWPRSK